MIISCWLKHLPYRTSNLPPSVTLSPPKHVYYILLYTMCYMVMVVWVMIYFTCGLSRVISTSDKSNTVFIILLTITSRSLDDSLSSRFSYDL